MRRSQLMSEKLDSKHSFWALPHLIFGAKGAPGPMFEIIRPLHRTAGTGPMAPVRAVRPRPQFALFASISRDFLIYYVECSSV
jgi:hypothetical protein